MCWLLYYLGTTCSSVNYVNSADKTSHNCTYCSNNWFWLFSYLTLMSFPFGVGSLVGSFFLQLNTFPFSMSSISCKEWLAFLPTTKQSKKKCDRKVSFYIVKVWKGWWYSSHENPAIFNILRNFFPLSFRCGRPRKHIFNITPLKRLLVSVFLAFSSFFFY